MTIQLIPITLERSRDQSNCNCLFVNFFYRVSKLTRRNFSVSLLYTTISLKARTILSQKSNPNLKMTTICRSLFLHLCPEMHTVTKMADFTKRKIFFSSNRVNVHGFDNFSAELIILTILTNFSKIRQGEISWADLTILTNFRHFGYCMHFWTLCFMQFAFFYFELLSAPCDIFLCSDWLLG